MIGPSLDYLEYQYDLANADAEPEDDGLEVFDCYVCRKAEQDCRCKEIATRFDPKPVPDRRWDWSAWQPANYDLGSPTGYGATEQEAIDDLKEQLEAA
jgi:hypothetical protein